ncbi:MAG: hypothetical protein OK442_05530 [Thaumarchaeota archaeon]|nr:hypothetical protein [Nitrososphaerota archaeon]
MSEPPAGADASEAPAHDYKLVSATYQDREYPEGVLAVNEAGNEIELRRWMGKTKRPDIVIARFHLEPNTDVRVDGAVLNVSELSVTLESPAAAGEVADLLRRPARELEAARLVTEVEASVGVFLETREEALNLLSRIKVDPRGALFASAARSTDSNAEPLDSVYSTYSARLAESLQKMKASLAGGEKGLGVGATDMMYAITYAIGQVQNALFEGDSDLVQELAALRELGIAMTAQELRTKRPTARLLVRAHPALVSLATSSLRSG